VEDKQDCFKFMESINSTEGWTIDSSSTKRIKVSYKKEEGQPTCTIKLEGIMHAPMLNLVSLANETDLFHTWIPLCK
jgi:hypothetical protein